MEYPRWLENELGERAVARTPEDEDAFMRRPAQDPYRGHVDPHTGYFTPHPEWESHIEKSVEQKLDEPEKQVESEDKSVLNEQGEHNGI